MRPGAIVVGLVVTMILLAGCGAPSSTPGSTGLALDSPDPGSGSPGAGNAVGAAGGPPQTTGPAPTASGATAPAATPAAPAATPAAPAVPGGVTLAERPPAAFLISSTVEPPGVRGEEGTYVWNGSGSDAPWLAPATVADSGPGPWTVTLAPPIPAERWTTRWSRAGTGARDLPGVRQAGDGDPIVVQAPGLGGLWTLEVEVSFGPGQRVVWFWTLDVTS